MTKYQMQAKRNQNNESSDVNALKSSSEKSNVRMVDDCKFCGKSHERSREKCPAYGKVCKKCRKENHVASKCTTQVYNAEFVVVDGNYTPLIGARAAKQMGLLQLVSNNQALAAFQSTSLTKEQELTDFADIFKGLDRMEVKLHLEVDDSISPVVIPPCGVPVALKGKFKEEIDRLIDVGV